MDQRKLQSIPLLFLILAFATAKSEETTTQNSETFALSEDRLQFSNISLQLGKALPKTNHESEIKHLLFQDSELPVLVIRMFHTYVQLRNLYLNNTKVALMGPGVFNGLTNLLGLYVNNNNITELTRGTLNSLTTLTVLNMSYNELSNIELGSFSGLYNLQVLILSHNRLKILDLETLVGLNSLEKLDVSFNNLATLNSKDSPVYLDLEKLRDLNLSNNRLKELPVLLVGNAKQLENLDASFNLLTELDFGLFATPQYGNYSNNEIVSVKGWKHMNKTEVIDLSKNYLKQIENEHVVDVKRIFLSYNELDVLPNNTFIRFNNLEFLDLSHNAIRSINTDAFNGLRKLNILHLSHNNLEESPVGCFREMSGLVEFSMSHNSLKNIHFGTFAGLLRLNNLDLSNNNLTLLNENALHVVGQLKVLNLGHNSLINLNAVELVSVLPNLAWIDINFNNFSCSNLWNITKTLKTLNVAFIEGSSIPDPNIFGIVCDDSMYQMSSLNCSTIDNNSSSCYWIILVILLTIGVILNSITVVHRACLKCRQKQKPDLDMKCFNAVTVVAKGDSTDNVYSNID